MVSAKQKVTSMKSAVRRPMVDQSRTGTGDCTCGYCLPDLVIGSSSPNLTIVMICPDCDERWDIELRATNRAEAMRLAGLSKQKKGDVANGSTDEASEGQSRAKKGDTGSGPQGAREKRRDSIRGREPQAIPVAPRRRR